LPRPRKYSATRRINIILPLKETEEIEKYKGKVSWGDFILELWEFWKAHHDLVGEVCRMADLPPHPEGRGFPTREHPKTGQACGRPHTARSEGPPPDGYTAGHHQQQLQHRVYKLYGLSSPPLRARLPARNGGDKEVYKSADVSIEQGKDKLVVEVFTGTKIVRIVAFRGYIEEVARREFGEPQPPMVAPPVPVITSTVDHDVSSSAQSAEVEEKASGEEKKEEKKEKKKKKRGRKKRKGEKRAETLKERVRILRIFNNTLMKYPSGYKVKVEGRSGNPSPVPTNLAISWVRDIIRKLELDTDDDVEVFEDEIKANLDKFDPVMKDLLKNLLESWRGYKVRKH